MTDTLKDNAAAPQPKATRTPRNLDSIRSGAFNLDLSDRVALVKDLQKSITEEVQALQDQAALATKIANGNNGQ